MELFCDIELTAILSAIDLSALRQLDWRTLLSYATNTTFVLALLSIPSVLLQRRGRPQAALAWVMVLFLFPILGLFLWWAIGRKHLVRRRRKKRRLTKKLSAKLNELQSRLPSLPKTEGGPLYFKRLPPEEAEWVLPATAENCVELLIDGGQAFPAMEDVIRNAQNHIHVLFYIWHCDDTGKHVRDLLIEKAKAGVRVRVLLDGVGCADSLGRFMNPLREAGAEVVAFMPPVFLRRTLELNFRNHRKLVLADGNVALLGGFNIGNEYRSDWRDTGLRISGPAVDQLQEVFVDDWHFATRKDFSGTQHFGRWRDFKCPDRPNVVKNVACSLVASGPHTEINLTHEAFFMAINDARQRIWLTTPYFVPDLTILSALRTAVIRGVDVRIMVPEHNDTWIVQLASRSYYPELLRAGVRIFEFGRSVLHAKAVVIDDQLSIIGSANVDTRSFRLNFELNCFLGSKELCAQLAEVFAADVALSREIKLKENQKSPYLTRLAEATAHLLSPLM